VSINLEDLLLMDGEIMGALFKSDEYLKNISWLTKSINNPSEQLQQ